MTHSIESRITCNKHSARDLRRRLEQRHANGTHARETPDRISDQELVETFLWHEQQSRAHSARQRAGSERC
jgi:hypothetical protein